MCFNITMYKGKKISVVFGTYREKKTIKKAIEDLFATKYVDEVIVVDNNAEVGTDDEVRKTKAKLFFEPRQGYGWAYQRAMKEATGDYIITTEADGTFRAKDIERLLVYSDEYEVVIGSRTSLIGSLEGIDGMSLLRKYANVIEAKTIEILFNTNALTDVGCTYKLFKRSAINKLKKGWRCRDALFNTELILLVVTKKIPFVEVPVAYCKRVGKSQVITGFLSEIKWAFVIQTYILYHWIKGIVARI